MPRQPSSHANVACVSLSDSLHVHLQILSLTFLFSVCIDALWLISFLLVVSDTASMCTKDTWFKFLTHISVLSTQAHIFKCPLNISTSVSKRQLGYWGLQKETSVCLHSWHRSLYPFLCTHSHYTLMDSQCLCLLLCEWGDFRKACWQTLEWGLVARGTNCHLIRGLELSVSRMPNQLSHLGAPTVPFIISWWSRK